MFSGIKEIGNMSKQKSKVTIELPVSHGTMAADAREIRALCLETARQLKEGSVAQSHALTLVRLCEASMKAMKIEIITSPQIPQEEIIEAVALKRC